MEHKRKVRIVPMTGDHLDEVAAYIREAVEKEAAQPAAVPPVPQTDPFEADNPEEADPGYFSDGPNGALEIPAE